MILDSLRVTEHHEPGLLPHFHLRPPLPRPAREGERGKGPGLRGGPGPWLSRKVVEPGPLASRDPLSLLSFGRGLKNRPSFFQIGYYSSYFDGCYAALFSAGGFSELIKVMPVVLSSGMVLKLTSSSCLQSRSHSNKFIEADGPREALELQKTKDNAQAGQKAVFYQLPSIGYLCCWPHAHLFLTNLQKFLKTYF